MHMRTGMKNITVALLFLASTLSPAAAQLTQTLVQDDINSQLLSCGNGCNTATSLRGLLSTIVSATFQAQGANGLIISGTPSAGYIPIATDATHATWSANPSGGVPITGTPSVGWIPIATSPTTAAWTNPIIASGSSPTTAGSCPTDTQVGGNTRGTLQLNGNCAAGTIVLTLAATAPNGWYCTAIDRTNPTNVFINTSSSATAATFTGTGSNNDVIAFDCGAY
jgi:hypothetical protein